MPSRAISRRYQHTFVHLVALLTVGVATSSSVGAHAHPRFSQADTQIDVGTRLVATRSVMLEQAELMKGSKVNVTNVRRDGDGRASVDVELADGYVVKKVALATIRFFFRVIGSE